MSNKTKYYAYHNSKVNRMLNELKGGEWVEVGFLAYYILKFSDLILDGKAMIKKVNQ